MNSSVGRSFVPDRVKPIIHSEPLLRSECSPTPTADMAWFLAIAVDGHLTGHERIMTFVELGCGEYLLAVERILLTVRSTRMVLPKSISDRVAQWLDVYVGPPEEPRLRAVLADVLAQQQPRVQPPRRQSA